MSLMLARGPMLRRHGAAATLADYYGIGPGQIPLDLNLLDPANLTLSGSNLVSAVNSGGAGSYFDLSHDNTNRRPLWTGSELQYDGVDDYSIMANHAELLGVHGFALVKPLAGIASNDEIMGSTTYGNGIPIYVGYGNCAVKVSTLQNPYPIRDRSTPNIPLVIGDWYVAEFRYGGGLFYISLNGASNLHTYATADEPLPMNMIARGRLSNRANIAVGRILSVVTDPAHSHDNPEPAVLLARQVFNDLAATLP